MSAAGGHEIERKYLIAMPDVGLLSAQSGCAVWQIEQIYLSAEPGCTRRIRRVIENGEVRCYKTFKRRITAVTCIEDEGRITEAEYEAYRAERNEALRPILKTRYRVPYEGQLAEIDVYPFWTDRAVLEVELESEDEAVHIPVWLHVYREVTADYRYKNVALAGEVPYDEV